MIKFIRKTTTWALALLFAMYTVIAPIHVNVSAAPGGGTLAQLDFHVPKFLEDYGGGVDYVTNNAWTLSKTAAPATLNLVHGTTGSVTFTVTATKVANSVFSVTYHVDIDYPTQTYNGDVSFSLAAVISAPSGNPVHQTQTIEPSVTLTEGGPGLHKNYTTTFTLAGPVSDYTPMKIEITLNPINGTTAQTSQSAAITFKSAPTAVYNASLKVSDDMYVAAPSLAYDWEFSATGSVTYSKSFASGTVGVPYSVTNHVTGLGSDGGIATPAQATVTVNTIKATGDQLSITGYSGVYDSADHSITINNLISGDVVYYSLNNSTWTTTKPMFTNVTAPAIVYVRVENPNFNDRTGSGTVEITARPISITANSSSKVYDGLALTNSGYSLTAGTLASGEALTAVTVTGSRTNVGSSANVPSAAVIMDGAVNASANYAITYVNGLLTVTAATGERLSITGYSNVYDSAPHSITVNNVVSGDVVYYSLTNNGSDWTTTKPMFTNVTAPATVYVKVVNSNYIDRTGSGTVEITVRPISITANSDTRVFNGLALTNSGYSLSAGTLAAGESFSGVTVIGSQTNVGSSDNIASAAVILDGATNVSANYSVTYVKGTLTVTPATGATLSINGYNQIYDSIAHSISINNLITGDVVYYSLTNNGTDWSTTLPMFTNVTPTTTVYVKVVNPNYFDRTGNGTVRIVIRPITITANSDAKVFDGTALTNLGYSLTSGTLAAGEAFDSVTVIGSQTVVGSSDNIASAAVILDGLNNVSANYSITYVKGTLTVTPAKGDSVNVISYSDVYDAGAHSISISNLITGDTVYYSLTNNGTDWTLTKPEFTLVQAPVTVFVKVTNPNYFDRTGSGTVEIKVRPITVTADSNSKAYDGLALTDSGYTLTSGTLASGEFFDSVNVIGSQTVVGSSDNVASAAVILNGLSERTSNYDITYVKGTLTVTKAIGADLLLTGYSAAYDALAHGISVDNAILGDTVYYSLTNNGTDWSTTNPMFTNVTAVTTVYVKVTNDNFADRTGSETVEITARQITVTANSDTKVYDGTALTNNGYTLTLGTLAAGESFDGVTVVGTQTVVGSSANTASAAIILNGSTDVSANYDITYVSGTLTVTPAMGALLDITGFNGVYDAAAHSILINNLIQGDVVYFSLTNNGSDWSTTLPTFTDVTAKTVYVKVVNPNYVDRTGNGTVDITARAITITANSATKAFDGLALANSGYSLTLGSLATGEAFEAVTVTGSQTAVGSSANVASAAVIMNGTTNVSANYAITYVSGTLTVTAPANTAPTAAGATYTILRGATITRFLFGNDVNGDPLTFQIVSQPTRGTLAVNGVGRFTYSNDGASLLSDSFTYRVYDGKLYSAIRTIRINFTELPAENTAPVVTDASFDTPFNTPLNQDVAPFGSDADSDPLTFILVTQPAHGTVTLSPSGSFHYVPNATYSGVDTFTFKANDGTDDSNVATITINVAKEIIIVPDPTPQAQTPWWWLLALLPFLLFLIRRPRPEVQEVVLNPDGTVTTTWGYLGPRLMHKDYDRDESVLEVVSGNVKVVPPIEVVPYEFDRGRHENIFKTVSDKNAVIRWTIKKKAEELDKELIEKMLEKNKK